MNVEQIRYIRDILDLSQRKLAEKLKVSKSTYARWETGEKIIPLIHLVNLCNLANISMDFALGLTTKKENNEQPYNLDNKKIGKNVSIIRSKNGLTQVNFAKSINTTQSVISDYENGKSLIQTSFLYDICLKYKVSANWIINNEPKK